jgi:hypothetical protein
MMSFKFDGCIVDRVNLREQVVWSHPRSNFRRPPKSKRMMTAFDRVQMLAEDYLKMGMARVEKSQSAGALQAGDPFSGNPGYRRRHHRHDGGSGCGQNRDMR